MSLPDLPRDVLLGIGQHLSRTDLVALSLVGKGLRELAQPLLYSSIRITWIPGCHPPILQLLRGLLERPFLANCVQNLRLDGSVSVSPKDQIARLDKFPDAIAKTAHQRLVSAMPTGVSPGTAHAWDNSIQQGNIDAIVALLVSLLPNLRRLHLSEAWTLESKFLGSLLEVSLSDKQGKTACCHTRQDDTLRLPKLASLHQVTLSARPDRKRSPYKKNTKAVLSLFYLPSIQELSVSIDSPADFSWPLPNRPTPLTLTSLEIHRLHELHLGPVLFVLQNLRRLRYNWVYQQNVGKQIDDDAVGLDTIALAIAQCHRLETLEITAACNPAESNGSLEPPSVQLQGSLGALSKLHDLKKMQIPWVFIMGMKEASTPNAGRLISSILPLNTEHLMVTGNLGSSNDYEWDETSIIESFEIALSNGLKARTKGLGSICLPYPQQSGLSPEYRAMLIGLHSQYSIEFTNQT